MVFCLYTQIYLLTYVFLNRLKRIMCSYMVYRYARNQFRQPFLGVGHPGFFTLSMAEYNQAFFHACRCRIPYIFCRFPL